MPPLQSPRKKFVRDCEKFLLGSAWVLLSKTDKLFSGALYSMCEVHYQLSSKRNGRLREAYLIARGCTRPLWCHDDLILVT